MSSSRAAPASSTTTLPPVASCCRRQWRGSPVTVLLSAGQAANNPRLVPLLDTLAQTSHRAEHLLADKAYSHPSTRRELRRRRIRHTIPERTDRSNTANPRAQPVADPPGSTPSFTSSATPSSEGSAGSSSGVALLPVTTSTPAPISAESYSRRPSSSPDHDWETRSSYSKINQAPSIPQWTGPDLRAASGNRTPDLLITRGLRIDGSGRYQRRHSSGDKHKALRSSWSATVGEHFREPIVHSG